MFQVLTAWFFSVLAVGGAIAMILQQRMIYSVGLMIVVLLAIAGMFLHMQFPFLFFVQVIVYAGAVMVLFLFTAMIVGEGPAPPLLIQGRHAWLVLTIVTLFVAEMGLFLMQTPGVHPPAEFGVVMEGTGLLGHLGQLLFTEYFVLLQGVGLLVLVALVGAVYLSRGVNP